MSNLASTTGRHVRRGVHVGAFMDPDLRARLAEQARENERTVSQELRLAVKSHLGENATRRRVA